MYFNFYFIYMCICVSTQCVCVCMLWCVCGGMRTCGYLSTPPYESQGLTSVIRPGDLCLYPLSHLAENSWTEYTKSVQDSSEEENGIKEKLRMGKDENWTWQKEEKWVLWILSKFIAMLEWSWRDSSAVKSRGCSSRRPGFDSHPEPTWWLTNVCNSNSRGSDARLL